MDVDNTLNELAGGARQTGRSVSGVAKWAHNTACGLNNAAFAARVDLDRLLEGTPDAPEFGQSRFAIARGQRVERIGREKEYEKTFEILDDVFGYPEERVAKDLRHGFGFGDKALDKRADATREAVADIVDGKKGAPNIIDGAVFAADLGGYRARLEADTVGARTGPELHVTEFKSWSKVDGQFSDAGKVGDALRQMGVYAVLLSRVIEEVGGDPDKLLSDVGLLITPRNVGLQLVGSPLPLRKARLVAETTIAALPHPSDLAGQVDPKITFGPVGDRERDPSERIEALDHVAEAFGTHYQSSCLESCGLAKFCRGQARDEDSPGLCGTNVVRMLPGVRTLSRASELAAGSTPSAEEVETGAADLLTETASVYDEAVAQLREAT